MNLAHIKGIVGRTKILVVEMLGINWSTDAHIVQILVFLVEVMIANGLEHGETQVLNRLLIFLIQRHIVEDQVAECHADNLTSLLQRVGDMAQVLHRLIAPTIHLVLIQYLRVRDGDISKVVGDILAASKHKLVVATLDCLTHGDIKSSQSLLLRQFIICWC